MTDIEGKITPIGDLLIYEKMAAIMADVPAIGKDQRNQEQRYAFRGVDDVYNALHGLFAKHGVFVIPEVLEAEYVQQERVSAKGRTNLVTDAHLRIRYHFYATDGSRVSAVVQGESRDYADKATNQATSSAIKYLLLQVFLIPTEDTVEADHQSPIVGEVVDRTPSPEEQRENWAKAMILEFFDGDKVRAKEHWDAGIAEGQSVETILAFAKEAGKPTPPVSLDEVRRLVAAPLDDPETGKQLTKPKMEALVRALARLAEGMDHIPEGEKDHPGTEDWLHYRLSRVGAAHLSELKVDEMRVFIEAMQSDVGATMVKS